MNLTPLFSNNVLMTFSGGFSLGLGDKGLYSLNSIRCIARW